MVPDSPQPIMATKEDSMEDGELPDEEDDQQEIKKDEAKNAENKWGKIQKNFFLIVFKARKAKNRKHYRKFGRQKAAKTGIWRNATATKPRRSPQFRGPAKETGFENLFKKYIDRFTF